MPDAVLPATVEATSEVRAAPSSLWPLLCDPSTPSKFSTELASARFVTAGGPRIGAIIEGRNVRGGFEWTTRSTVIACDEPTRFSWATGDEGDPTATWSFLVVGTDVASTLTHRVILHPGKPPLSTAIEREPDRAREIVATRLSELAGNMDLTVKGIASIAEGQAREP